jgi:hypothetical protein
MNNAAFSPMASSTFFVDSSAAVQVTSASTLQLTNYRVRNLSLTAQAWFQSSPPGPSAAAPAGMVATAPALGTPSPRTIGMLPASVEVFTLSPNSWFIASAGASFEICVGDGL